MSDAAEGHRYFEGMAVSHVLGGLDESMGRVFRSHLLECADCRARVGELRALAHDLADVERDERRVHAAKAIETKRREPEDDDGADAPAQRSPWVARIFVVGGLLVVAMLLAWNSALRTSNGRQAVIIDNLETAGTVAQLGAPAALTYFAPGVEAEVKSHEGMVVLIVDGLATGEWYGIWGRAGTRGVTFKDAKQALNERLYVLIRQPRGADEIVVRAIDEGEPVPEDPAGEPVLEASLTPAS